MVNILEEIDPQRVLKQHRHDLCEWCDSDPEECLIVQLCSYAIELEAQIDDLEIEKQDYANQVVSQF